MPEPAAAWPAAGSAAVPAAESVDRSAAGPAIESESAGGFANDAGASLPVMPGFREMALHRSADAQAAQAARMGTSQSAVARLESGTADVRASTLERYAAAVGSEITWKLNRPGDPG